MFSQKKLHKIRKLLIIVIVVFFAELSFPFDAKAQEAFVNNQEEQENDVQIEAVKLPEIPDKPKPEAKRVVNVTITAYSSTPDQTSGDPFITASGTRVRDGVIAANFLPIGTKVRLPEKFGDKIFVVEDRMHSKYWYHADIWMQTREQAKEWGVKYLQMEIL